MKNKYIEYGYIYLSDVPKQKKKNFIDIMIYKIKKNKIKKVIVQLIVGVPYNLFFRLWSDSKSLIYR